MSGYFQTLNPASILSRPWPYPYKGGLAISNDVEFMSFEYFELLMEFLNTENETLLGKGLGINVTSSFFFYSANQYNFCFSDGIGNKLKKKPYSSRIEEYLQSGWIDTIHAYGDFDGVGGFQRELAQAYYEAMEELGVTIEVFTNHGSSDNVQNVGTDAGYHKGDQRNNIAYHADLMKLNGIRYIWTDSMVVEKNIPTKKSQAKKYIRKYINYIKGIHERSNSRLTFSETLQDGNEFRGFTRFRSTGLNAPNLSSLGAQLDQIDWDSFYHSAGGLIIYQHLGVLYRAARQCIKASVDGIKSRPEIFLRPFYQLEKEVKEGRLWMEGLAWFLNYVEMVESTQIIKHDNGVYELMGDTNGKTAASYFQGLTIYTNPNNPIILKYKNQKINFIYNGPDSSGQYSVTVPFGKKPKIWP